MATLDTLPADQRAVLELVLRQGRSYDEIAKLLSIDRAGVRERALAALDALGPSTPVPPESRALITDYLLGALPEPVALEVRERLAQSASERAWARVVASELQGIGDRALPEIPTASAPPPPADRPPSGNGAAPAAKPQDRRPVSRRGGALLLAGGGLVVLAVVLVLVLSGGGGRSKPTAAATKPATTPATTTPSTSTTGAQILAQINLKPPSGGTSPIGIAEVLSDDGKLGIAIVAQGLAPNSKSPANAYAVWLSNSPTDSHILGFVNPAVGSNGRLQTAGGLPGNASHYHKLLVTLETQSDPKTPGQIILEGPLSGL